MVALRLKQGVSELKLHASETQTRTPEGYNTLVHVQG